MFSENNASEWPLFPVIFQIWKLFSFSYLFWFSFKCVVYIGSFVLLCISKGPICIEQNTVGSSGDRVVKLLACGAKRPGFDSRPRHLNFQGLVISCFQVAMLLKYRWSDVKTITFELLAEVTYPLVFILHQWCLFKKH